MTGAPMPAGADTVVQVEATDGGTDAVAVLEPREPGTHVRSAGEDVSSDRVDAQLAGDRVERDP